MFLFAVGIEASSRWTPFPRFSSYHVSQKNENTTTKNVFTNIFVFTLYNFFCSNFLRCCNYRLPWLSALCLKFFGRYFFTTKKCFHPITVTQVQKIWRKRFCGDSCFCFVLSASLLQHLRKSQQHLQYYKI